MPAYILAVPRCYRADWLMALRPAWMMAISRPLGRVSCAWMAIAGVAPTSHGAMGIVPATARCGEVMTIVDLSDSAREADELRGLHAAV
ncbi:hypothetical protein WME91_12505 [Sorangium sp. So ce269]